MNTKVLSRICTSGVQSEEDVGKAQKLAGELDSLESLVAQASEQLTKRIRVVIRRLWSAGVPGEIESTVDTLGEMLHAGGGAVGEGRFAGVDAVLLLVLGAPLHALGSDVPRVLGHLRERHLPDREDAQAIVLREREAGFL